MAMQRQDALDGGGALGALTVADVMTPSVFTLSRETTVERAAHELSQRRIGGAPVVEGTQILGVVSKSDLVETTDGSVTVERMMTAIPFAVRSSDPAMTAVRLMLYERVHRVLVMDRDRLVGIVTTFDILAALSRTDEAPDSRRASGEWHAPPASAISVDVRRGTGRPR